MQAQGDGSYAKKLRGSVAVRVRSVKHGVSSWLKVAKTIRPFGRFEQKGEGSELN